MRIKTWFKGNYQEEIDLLSDWGLTAEEWEDIGKEEQMEFVFDWAISMGLEIGWEEGE